MRDHLIASLETPIAPTQSGQSTATVGIEVSVGIGVAIWATTVYSTIYTITSPRPY